MIKNKSIKIYLVENINTLEEIIILPHELSGNIAVDVEKSEVVEPFTFSYNSFDDYDFSADYKSEVENIAINNTTFNYGLNVVNIFSQLIKPLFKNKNKKRKDKKPNIVDAYSATDLSNKYTLHFLSKGFNIPNEKASLFIEYAENNGLTEELLKKGNEMKLIKFLHEKSKQYLEKISDKD